MGAAHDAVTRYALIDARRKITEIKTMSTEPTTSRTMRPVVSHERIDSLDVLRGVAILGVLLAYALWSLGSPPPETWGTGDQLLNSILSTVIDTKAYTLLAFMFGLGFSIQLTRSEERGSDIVPIFVRRLLALLGIGILHAMLLRNGDILVPYATVGFALLLFRKASNGVLLASALAGCALPFIARWIWEVSGVPYPERPDTIGMSHFAANAAYVKYWYATAITIWPEMLPMFMCGLYVGRKRVMENLPSHTKTLRRIMVAGLVGGVAIYVGRLVVMGLVEWPERPVHPIRVLMRLSWNAHAWGLAAFYGAGIVLLMQRGWVQRLSAPFAAVGRMSLTNYLLQSIIIVPICILFDLYDKVTPGLGLLLAVGVAAFQIPMSVIWLRYFRFGPAEWLWRSITYGRIQRMRRDIAGAKLNSYSAQRC